MPRKLESFVKAHERKLQAKIDSAVQDQRQAEHHGLAADSISPPVSPRTYRTILLHQFAAPKTRVRRLPRARYVLTALHRS